MVELTLVRQEKRFADPREQVRFLEHSPGIPSFPAVLNEAGVATLHAVALDVLQVNVGKVCNQTCRHCHVDAGPDRREAMSREVADACLRLLAQTDIGTLDITGGAPEMNPQFRHLVTQARQLGRRVIDRCNLTILLANGYDDLAEFLASQRVEIVASLPCYLEENVDRQRGSRVFERSIEALRRLNALGYGLPGTGLELTLVYNPTGASLPPPQVKLEADYRRELRDRYGLEFNQLFTVTNMPISRFLDDLVESGRYEKYLTTLVHAFNPATLPHVMCRNMLSVDWQGNLYDCDFNQMLELGLAPGQPVNVCGLEDDALRRLGTRPITTGRHCFGCTAGAGSSCGGSLVGAG